MRSIPGLPPGTQVDPKIRTLLALETIVDLLERIAEKYAPTKPEEENVAVPTKPEEENVAVPSKAKNYRGSKPKGSKNESTGKELENAAS